MVKIVAGQGAREIHIYGHGLTLERSFELTKGVWVDPEIPDFGLPEAAEVTESFFDYAAAVYGKHLATFTLRVTADEGKALAVRAWNSLWLFHLLGLANRAPCLMLFSMSSGPSRQFSAVSPDPFVRPLSEVKPISAEQLQWAKQHHASFDALREVGEFDAALRCYGNAFYLQDMRARLMLLWAGIEGLLSVDAELSRRLALYVALLSDRDVQSRVALFEQVKKAYGLRSRTVHGAKTSAEKVKRGLTEASEILVALLARCVELGRVPSTAELDRAALGETLS